jgi:DNA-binding response OmpR family regulator
VRVADTCGEKEKQNWSRSAPHSNKLNKQGVTSVTAKIKTAFSRFRRPLKASKPNSALLLDEVLTSIQDTKNVQECRKLSHFLPVVVFIPTLAEDEKATRKDLASNTSDAGFHDGQNAPPPVKAAMAWLRGPGDADTFAFGEVTVSFSTMEVHRKGQSVALTRKEFKTMAFLIKNARRVISRDELLKEVWGYKSYTSTRTVDTHILNLRVKLEARPGRPKHFLTVHGAGYRFVP